MSKPEWGNKHICANCGGRFYDMKKSPAVCPKCGTVDESDKRKAKKKAPAREAVVEKPTPVKDLKKTASDDDDVIDDDDDDLLIDDDDDDDDDDFDDIDDDLIEDASDLGDEDDDLSEAKEHLDDDETT